MDSDVSFRIDGISKATELIDVTQALAEIVVVFTTRSLLAAVRTDEVCISVRPCVLLV